jgi:hypothetical protein
MANFVPRISLADLSLVSVRSAKIRFEALTEPIQEKCRGFYFTALGHKACDKTMVSGGNRMFSHVSWHRVLGGISRLYTASSNDGLNSNFWFSGNKSMEVPGDRARILLTRAADHAGVHEFNLLCLAFGSMRGASS